MDPCPYGFFGNHRPKIHNHRMVTSPGHDGRIIKNSDNKRLKPY
jgi:hypothetical protein